MSELVERYQKIRDEVNNLSKENGRNVCLIAVSKTKSIESIVELYQSGQRDFGENYVNELEKKSTDSLIKSQCPEIRWHFIGHLQSNKVSRILSRVENLQSIQTIDSIELAQQLNKHLQQQSRKLQILLQIKTSNEEQKSGLSPENFLHVFNEINSNCQQLIFRGLMTIGSMDNVNNDDDSDFRVLIRCRDDLIEKSEIPIDQIELSMGMSNDYQRAIRAGSTIVRIGSSIFGSRA